MDPAIWHGKDEQDAGGRLTVVAPLLFAQEKVYPKELIGDLIGVQYGGGV